MIEAAGFTIVEAPDPDDLVNVLFVAKKNGEKQPFIERDAREVETAEHLMTDYITERARNLLALQAVTAELAGLSKKRIALWGAGRLFDSLVLHGNFNPKSLMLLIDTHLKKHMDERHGVPLATPDALDSAKPDVIVVMSRGFADEIVAEAHKRCPAAEILLYGDLLARARLRQAA
jgi:hypothetical protein